jgi:hypothetical protein
VTAPLPIGYRDSSLSVEFLRGQFHRFVHLRWSFADLRDFARVSEELLKRRHREARDTERFALSPFIVRGSILVMACGVLESFMSAFCDLLYQAQGFALSPGDLRGSGVERARTYIKKVAGLPFPDGLWPNLLALFNVRHAIVHANGRLRDAGKLQSVRQHFPSVAIDPNGEIWPEAEAIETALDLLENFTDQMEQEIVGPSRRQSIEK